LQEETVAITRMSGDSPQASFDHLNKEIVADLSPRLSSIEKLFRLHFKPTL